jgi:hypothetical protein
MTTDPRRRPPLTTLPHLIRALTGAPAMPDDADPEADALRLAPEVPDEVHGVSGVTEWLAGRGLPSDPTYARRFRDTVLKTRLRAERIEGPIPPRPARRAD